MIKRDPECGRVGAIPGGSAATPAQSSAMFWPVHADDLSAGDAGRDVISARVRQALVNAYDDPPAPWQAVEAAAWGSSSQMCDGPVPV